MTAGRVVFVVLGCIVSLVGLAAFAGAVALLVRGKSIDISQERATTP
jgi:hypothetical protein